MKTEQYFAPFLNKHGYLTINGIGHFRLSNQPLADNGTTEVLKKSLWQKNKWIGFEYNALAAIDPKLVEYLHEETYGDNTVIKYNLQTYTGLTYEMLKLGFEVELPGLGHLRLDKNTHQVAFSPYGQSAHNAMHINKTAESLLPEEAVAHTMPSFSFNRIMKKITDYIS
jgi:hypothetical protein